MSREKTMTPMTLCCVVRGCNMEFGSDGVAGQGASGGCPGGWLGRVGGGRKDGSRACVSKLLRKPSKNGKVQAGSEPGLLTLLGMNLSGIAARRSEPTCAIVTRIARITRSRYPLRLRYRNFTKNSIEEPLFGFGDIATVIDTAPAIFQ